MIGEGCGPGGRVPAGAQCSDTGRAPNGGSSLKDHGPDAGGGAGGVLGLVAEEKDGMGIMLQSGKIQPQPQDRVSGGVQGGGKSTGARPMSPRCP